MIGKTRASIKNRLWTAGAVLALFAFAPYASANVVRIHFSSAVLGSGYADLTIGPAGADDVVDASHPPKAITDASGSFNGAMITGLQALNHAIPPPGEVLPASYSLFSIPGYGDHDGVSYNNLFYSDGSPMLCLLDGTPIYPFSGGFLDIMGVMFVLDNGDFLDLWSFGYTPPGFVDASWPGGLVYGMKLIQPITGGGYQVLAAPPFATASVPEPNFLWLLGAGVLGLFEWRRRIEKKTTRILD